MAKRTAAKAAPKPVDNPKAKNNEVVAQAEAVIDPDRFLNEAGELELTIGTFEVKELGAFDLMKVIAEGAAVLIDLYGDDNDTDEFNFDLGTLLFLMEKEEFKLQCCKIFAIFCQTKDWKQFNNIKTRDLTKLLQVIKDVTDFDEVKQLFLSLNLQKSQTTTPTSTE